MKKLLLGLLLCASPAFGAATAYENYVTNNFAPTLFYYGTEASGNIINNGSSGSNYNLTTGTAPTYAQSGVSAARGTSLLFTAASSQFMHVNRNDTGTGPADMGSARTVECWQKFASTGIGQTGISAGSAESGSNNDRTWSVGMSATAHPIFIIYTNDGANYSQGVGASTLTTGIWYLISGTWDVTATRNTVYLNGVQDFQTTTTNPPAPNAVQFIAMARRTGANDAYMNGNTQDCLIIASENSAANVLARYNFGTTNAVTGWPFLTKRPDIPQFRDDGWLEKVKSRGYMTGFFTPQAREPLWLTVGWLPFSTLPPGNVR